MSFEGVRERIEALREHPNGFTVFGAAHHRWVCGEPWSSDELVAFEAKNGALPQAYRQWLLAVGAGGAGPGNGLFVPGWIDGKRASKRFGPLDRAFPLSSAGAVVGKPPGLLPLCDLGCGLTVVLVTAGEQHGRVWVDQRADRAGYKPEGFRFSEWVEAWLSASETQADDPWKPSPRRPNEPSEVVAAADVLGPEVAGRLVAHALGGLEEHGEVKLPARLGWLRRKQGRTVFEAGSAVQKVLDGRPVPEKRGEPWRKLVNQVADQAPYVAVELPGLLQVWVRENKRGESRDYLGRPMYFGFEGRSLTVRALA